MFDHSSETGTAPKAYLNFIVFDRDFNPIIGESGFIRITTNSKETGNNAPQDNLQRTTPLVITKPGYVYIYLSNENGTPVEVPFDDFRVEPIKSPVVQIDDYYLFGLTFNSLQRENSVEQRWKFQGQEHIDDLGLNWDSFKWRNHQPDIGRFFNIDPLAEKYVYNSPYAFSENKVTAHVELEGLESWYAADGSVVNGPMSKRTIQEQGLRAVQGVSAHAGYTGIQSQRVRSEYNSRVSKLAPTDSQGRTQAKIEAREKTPAITRAMAEKMRPMSEESGRMGGTANRTNAGVNSKVETMGKIGKIGGAAAVTVMNSPGFQPGVKRGQ